MAWGRSRLMGMARGWMAVSIPVPWRVAAVWGPVGITLAGRRPARVRPRITCFLIFLFRPRFPLDCTTISPGFPLILWFLHFGHRPPPRLGMAPTPCGTYGSGLGSSPAVFLSIEYFFFFFFNSPSQPGPHTPLGTRPKSPSEEGVRCPDCENQRMRGNRGKILVKSRGNRGPKRGIRMHGKNQGFPGFFRYGSHSTLAPGTQ